VITNFQEVIELWRQEDKKQVAEGEDKIPPEEEEVRVVVAAWVPAVIASAPIAAKSYPTSEELHVLRSSVQNAAPL
jgi:hypothetical protein